MSISNAALDEAYTVLQGHLADYLLGGGQLAVIKAPPGSGKTFTLIEVLSELVVGGGRIAVAVQTNTQADDICTRFARDHPDIATARFASNGSKAPADFPVSVAWITNRAGIGAEPGVTVATTAKWSLTDIAEPFDLLAIDEAWQMSWADLMQCALLSEAFLMIGDPGQIPPVVAIDVRRWETSPRAPHEAAPEIVLAEESLNGVRFVGSLPACRRLPNESVKFVKPFYDFDFAAYVSADTRGVDLPTGHRFAALADGRPLALTLPTPEQGPPIEVDTDIAAMAATVVADLFDAGAQVRDGKGPARTLSPRDIGVSSSHRVMNAALAGQLAAWGAELRVDTPERWQGLERPVMIVVHPLSGVTDPSSFDLQTGRLCVMTSRHRSALIVLTRDHVGTTLANFVPSAGQAPGRPDVVGRGHDAHMQFWQALAERNRIVPVS